MNHLRLAGLLILCATTASAMKPGVGRGSMVDATKTFAQLSNIARAAVLFEVKAFAFHDGVDGTVAFHKAVESDGGGLRPAWDFSKDTAFIGFNYFTPAISHELDAQNLEYISTQNPSVTTNTPILGSGPVAPYRQRDWFEPPRSYLDRFGVMCYCLSHPAVRSFISYNKVLKRAAADGPATFMILHQFFNAVFYNVFGDEPIEDHRKYYNFWWWYSRRCITMPEIESWLTNLFSCVFGKAIGYQLWWSWHGLSPAAAQLNWNADYKFRQHRRSEYVNLLKKYGGGIVITLGGFCLAVHGALASARQFDITKGLMTLALNVRPGFDVTTNGAVRWFVYHALQIAHAGSVVSKKTALKAIHNMMQIGGFTVGALSFEISPAAPEDTLMCSDVAIAMFKRKQSSVQEFTIAKHEGVLQVKHYIEKENMRQKNAKKPAKKKQRTQK